MGGIYDSTKTRVVPVFHAISNTGPDWLRRLLTLPESGAPAASVDMAADLTALRGRWGDGNEQLLDPPLSLLRWLVQNLQVSPPDKDVSEVARKRRLLARRDASTITEALRHLQQGIAHRQWWVLEGPTHPDVYLETPDALVVIEGKRTEAGPTTHTTWMPGRHQMQRHLDAAWEVRGMRRIYGFFIVEDEKDPGAVPDAWKGFARATYSTEVLDASLPHRTAAEREAIARCFLGVTTWQKVLVEFGLDAVFLPASC